MRLMGSIKRQLIHEGTVFALLILFLCVCVLLQMLGAPVTLLGLLMLDTPVESPSEDFSIPPITPELGFPSHYRFSVESQSLGHLSIFTAVFFHPPQG